MAAHIERRNYRYMPAQIHDPFDKVYNQDPNIVARQIAGEMILVPIRQNMGDLESIYLLNETAVFAWQLLDGNKTLADIRSQIVKEFEVDEQQAGQDLLDLVTDLERVKAVLRA
jgi:hypothetical protein